MSPALRPSRHELPDIDAAALEAARAADPLLAAARELSDRWERYLERIPDRLRDDTLPELKSTVRIARAAYGPKDSIRDMFPAELTEPFLDRLDRLNKAINRWEANRG
jgi:hypothetical protein